MCAPTSSASRPTSRASSGGPGAREPAGRAPATCCSRLDDQPFRSLSRAPRRRSASSRNDIDALQARYGDMQAQIRQAEVDVAFYDARERAPAGSSRSARSRRRPPSTRRSATCSRAQERVASLTQQLAGIAANLGGDAAMRRSSDHPRFEAVLAARDEAARQLDHTDGARADRRHRHQRALAAARPVSRRRDHRLRSRRDRPALGRRQSEGDGADVCAAGPAGDVDGRHLSGHEWHGTVESISPASAASFSLLPAQNTSGNWVKVVQRIPMRVRIETPRGPAAAARRHERRQLGRHRASARPAAASCGTCLRWLSHGAPSTRGASRPAPIAARSPPASSSP